LDIEKILKMQKSFDSKHGWSLKNNSPKERLEIINKDLIGLIGEVGEFSNIIKKLNLIAEVENTKNFESNFIEKKIHLEEELIDSFIYILRIATHLEVDITENYLRKLSINQRRFAKYENIDSDSK
jgi:NTP pyrophosphatase (non-canonical NTP hydrolase)